MIAKFICHPDFSELVPYDIFHKEHEKKDIPSHPKDLQNRHILFRKKFSISCLHTAGLKISADDRYRLFINGIFVTEGPSPSYPNNYYYNEIDVRNFLHCGENTIAVHTYYQGLINRVHVSGDLRQMLYLELDVNGETALVSDGSFLCAEHTGFDECGIIAKGTAFAECYDSRCAEDNFFECDFDDSAWKSAAVYKNADYSLVRQPTRQLAYEAIVPTCIQKISGGIRVDFGRECAGYLSVNAHGKEGNTVILRYGEELEKDGSVRFNMRSSCNYEEKWILSGRAEDTLTQFDYRGFRYVEILYPDTVCISHIAMIARHYPYSERFIYKTRDRELQNILRLCADTVRYGTQEGFIDCPTREKGQYLGDVAVAARAQTILTGDTAMIKKAISDFCATAFICKGLMAVSTASKMQEIADYSLLLPSLTAWVYSYDGDIDFVRRTEPYITELYEYMSGYERSDGLIENVCDKWNLVDWPDNLRDGYSFSLTNPPTVGIHNVINAFWCGFLQSTDEVYSIIGMAPTGKTEKAKQSFINEFYNVDSGLFCDTPELSHSAVHSNLLPLLFDIGTKDKALCDRIAEFIKEKRLTSTGVYMSYFALAALVNHGYEDIAKQLILDNGCWKNMLREGATTTFEAWGKEQKKNCSLFHPWAVAPLIVLADKIRIY